MTVTQTLWRSAGAAPGRSLTVAVPVHAPQRAEALMTVKDVAVACQLSETAVRRAIASGELPALKLRSRMRVARGDFEAWLLSQRHAPIQTASPARPVARGRRPAPVGTFRALAQGLGDDAERRS